MKESISIPCYHCGDNCGPNPVIFEDKSFCCYGCKTVFEILSNNDACQYYSIEDHPGKTKTETELGNKYAFLDNEEIRQELLEFTDGNISKVKFFIPSIHCSSCIWLLENLNRLDSGIIQSSVNFVKKEVSITFKEKAISFRKVVELLTSINYVPQITLNDIDKSRNIKSMRTIYYQLGVAGFCFGNIMLFSFPDYLAGRHAIDSDFIHNFSYLNLFLSLPVVFYAAREYFISAFKGLRKLIINIDVPIALGISVLFLRSAYDILSGSGQGYMDSLSGLVFFLLIGKWYQGKTYQALSFERDYKSYFPLAVTIIDDEGNESTMPLKKLKPGQRIVVRNQELIPADSILIKGDANIDYSFVSGESNPVQKKINERIYAGGRQLGSSLELLVEKQVIQSYLTELWNQDMHGKPGIKSLNSIINKVSQYFTISIIFLSLVAGIFWLIKDPAVAMNAFTSVLIVACPCALALTLPFALGNTMRIFGKGGFYVKKTEIIEQLSKINTIVFDKTGTLTRNDVFNIDSSNIELTEEETGMIKSMVKHSSHPLSYALYQGLAGEETDDLRNFTEKASAGIEALVAGKLIRIGSDKFTDWTSLEKNTGTSNVFVSIDGMNKGYYSIKNRYRPGLEAVMESLGKHYELHLLSGDNESEKSNMQHFMGKESFLNFNQSPSDKLYYIRKLKDEGKQVLMVGDGLNDAGALNESLVGITIADNVYHFSPASDGILESGNFNMIPAYIRFSKTAMRAVMAGYAISLLYNIFGISFAASGMLTPLIAAILMPLSSVTVVAFATFSTYLLARRHHLIS